MKFYAHIVDRYRIRFSNNFVALCCSIVIWLSNISIFAKNYKKNQQSRIDATDPIDFFGTRVFIGAGLCCCSWNSNSLFRQLNNGGGAKDI